MSNDFLRIKDDLAIIHQLQDQKIIAFDDDWNITYLHPNILESLSKLIEERREADE